MVIGMQNSHGYIEPASNLVSPVIELRNKVCTVEPLTKSQKQQNVF